MNSNDLYKFMQDYIDKRLYVARGDFKELFDEYNIKDIADNIDSIEFISRTYLGALDYFPMAYKDATPLETGAYFFYVPQKIIKIWDGDKWIDAGLNNNIVFVKADKYTGDEKFAEGSLICVYEEIPDDLR